MKKRKLPIFALFASIIAVTLLCGCPEKEKTADKSRGVGMNLYRAYCGDCHGIDGQGGKDESGNVAPALNSRKTMQQYDDSVLFEIIVTGHDKMPGSGSRLDIEKANEIIQYLRFISKDKGV